MDKDHFGIPQSYKPHLLANLSLKKRTSWFRFFRFFTPKKNQLFETPPVIAFTLFRESLSSTVASIHASPTELGGEIRTKTIKILNLLAWVAMGKRLEGPIGRVCYHFSSQKIWENGHVMDRYGKMEIF